MMQQKPARRNLTLRAKGVDSWLGRSSGYGSFVYDDIAWEQTKTQDIFMPATPLRDTFPSFSWFSTNEHLRNP